MGIAVSRYSDLADNELLIRFCSTEVLCPNEPFWNQLLAFNINPPSSAEEQLIFDSSTEALLQKFLVNNPQTGNLGSLVQVFITRATELLASPSTDNVMLAWQTYNALFVIRGVVKYLVEVVPEYRLGQHLDVQGIRGEECDPVNSPPTPPTSPVSGSPPTPATPTQDSPTQDSPTQDSPTQDSPILPLDALKEKPLNSESRLEMLCDALIGLICHVNVTDNTYYLHLECINTLLVLMSVYMFANVHGQTRLVETSLIYRTIFVGRYSLLAPLLVRALLNNTSALRAAPEHKFAPGGGHNSLVINLASGLWNMLSFNKSYQRPTLLTNPTTDPATVKQRLLHEHPVANQSCLLLLVLTNHCVGNNLYRTYTCMCADTADPASTTPQKEGNAQITPPRIEMAALHRALCATASCEHTTLLIYLMLHSSAHYRRYVHSHPHVEEMIIPILQSLYNAEDSTSHHMYMSLIVLLILTEDDNLIKSVHQIMIKNPSWYTERAIPEISVGGLMVLVMIRTVQYNIVRARDKYLHTNCLAAIANMSCEFRNLHPYVAQRLVGLYETLSKRRARLSDDLEEKDLVETEVNETWEHMGALDEVLRMLLEIMNCCLSAQLQNNLNLVYALLHKKHVFETAHSNVALNINMVIGYFSSRLQRVQEGAGGDLGVSEVLACIKKGAEQWSNDRLQKFPELKFRYVEEEKPEEFFTPYVWSLVSSCGTIYWASECSARAVRDLVC